MDRAFPPDMRTLRFLIPMLLVAACGDDPMVLSGVLAEGTHATHVWVLGEPQRSTVDADSFRIEGVEGELLDLRFAAGEREVARMEIQGLAPGDRLTLRDIWFDDGMAHPSAVEREGSGLITVNGLRMGGAATVPAAVDVEGTVLAVSGEGDALMMRPAGSQMPDLRIVVTPGTSVRTPDGDPADADELEFGDTLRVVGQGESGFVVATELVLPRSRAGRSSSTAPVREAPRVTAVSRREPGAGIGAPEVTPSGREGEGGRGKVRDEAKNREKERGKAREKEKGKGKGKG